MCEAAHAPVIWATEVLGRLISKGSPSRGEFTDSAMGVRAECVMLNKGPFLPQAVDALATFFRGCKSTRTRKSRGCGH